MAGSIHGREAVSCETGGVRLSECNMTTRTNGKRTDAVRASRDGHEFHEIWTARKATQMLLPNNKLKAIAVEGLSPRDQLGASRETMEIADLVYYFGCGAGFDFESAEQVVITQFKYFVSCKGRDYRVHHAKKTIKKFAEAYKDHIRRYGAGSVKDKLSFEIVTNRPICGLFRKVVFPSPKEKAGRVQGQINLIKRYTDFSGDQLIEFIHKIEVIGRAGDISTIRRNLGERLIDWSAAADAMASARLGKLLELVRRKAGQAGAADNIIAQTDVLDALGIGDISDLLPCEPSLPEFGNPFEREQFSRALAEIEQSQRPVLVHGAGGVGKTVFLRSLCRTMSEDHETVFFDCFGGGNYRSPEDARHLPNKGLLHVMNSLALGGLCDPVLPGSSNVPELLKTFRRRMTKCVEAISRHASNRNLAVFIDAIDNAEWAAKRMGENCFPVSLLECIDAEQIPGLKLIVACRTDRMPDTHAEYHSFELQPFSRCETSRFLKSKLERQVSETEIDAEHSRSAGNARVLDYLAETGHGLLGNSALPAGTILLGDLIKQQVDRSISNVAQQGYEEGTTQNFLTALAVLPLPVPLEEFAEACGVNEASVKSFASDMRPLLEYADHGIVFRDEPTETFMQQRYASNRSRLSDLASSLLERQDRSVYAARALPGLLRELDDEELLLKLAFDNRIPDKAAGISGNRKIRYARLKAAIAVSASKKNYNNLVKLLVEVSTIAAVSHKGADYILAHPELAFVAKDVEAMRRLFEEKIGWPGVRHAGLATTYALSGQDEDASRHIEEARKWIAHRLRSASDAHQIEQAPDHKDIASVPFVLITGGQTRQAAEFLNNCRDWFAFEVCVSIYRYSLLARKNGRLSSRTFRKFTREIDSIGSLSAAISLFNLPQADQKELLSKLSSLCKDKGSISIPLATYHDGDHKIHDGLRKSAAVSLALGMKEEAREIVSLVSQDRPNLWGFCRAFNFREVLDFIFGIALTSVVKGDDLHEQDILPKEIYSRSRKLGRNVSGEAFREKAKATLEPPSPKRQGLEGPERIPLTGADREMAESFIDRDLEVIFRFTLAMAAVLKASRRTVDNAFLDFLNTWGKCLKGEDVRDRHYGGSRFYNLLGREIAIFLLWSIPHINQSSISKFINIMESKGLDAGTRIRIVGILSQSKSTHDLAGGEALKAKRQIEEETDVRAKADLFGKLSRAMLPVDEDDAAVYFRNGLEQMDAISSGDHRFTMETLSFATQLKGEELEENDFHTLSNICEMDFGEETERFCWGKYGLGLAKASGLRGLAKIIRWDDRSKVDLANTLLPYLIGLLKSGKIDPKDALSINRLAKPVEYFDAGTKEFAEAVSSHENFNVEILTELIDQFQDDNPGVGMPETLDYLKDLSDKTLGSDNELTMRLAALAKAGELSRNVQSNEYNHQGQRGNILERSEIEKSRRRLITLAGSTNFFDEQNLSDAVEELNRSRYTYELANDFFKKLRSDIARQHRSEYLRRLANLENLNFHWKMIELQRAKAEWNQSSISLSDTLKALAETLIAGHGPDLIFEGGLHGSALEEIADLTSVPPSDLAVELAKLATDQKRQVSGAAWMALAARMCAAASEGEGQAALSRFLRSDQVQSASNADGGGQSINQYPRNEEVGAFAGMIWSRLGASAASGRWRAAHALRSFAGFGRWDVIDAVVGLFTRSDCAPFQAKEIPFLYMHARQWLLIAMARLAITHPHQIARHKEMLLSVLRERDPHVLMRHFASQALLVCKRSDAVALSDDEIDEIESVNSSPHPYLANDVKGRWGFHSGRPDSEQEPLHKFDLGYDFHKNKIDVLARVFGQHCWKVEDLVSKFANKIDPTAASMLETGGRNLPYSQQNSEDVDSENHGLGQQIGYHALFQTAAYLLEKYPVVKCDFREHPWEDWLREYTCTRSDGLWLSDGTDRAPIDIHDFLLERDGEKNKITGDKGKILKLLKLKPLDRQLSAARKQIVIRGHWVSYDDIDIEISSALVSKGKSDGAIQCLIDEEPILAWVPSYLDRYDTGEHRQEGEHKCDPWVVAPFGESCLDEFDPYGVGRASVRYRMGDEINQLLRLNRADEFGREWKDNKGVLRVVSQVWGRRSEREDGGDQSGSRLLISTFSLKKVLENFSTDLVILIVLKRHEKFDPRRIGKFSYTVAVVRITKDLKCEFFGGKTNYVQQLPI